MEGGGGGGPDSFCAHDFTNFIDITSAALPASGLAAPVSGLLGEELCSTGASEIDSFESDRYHLQIFFSFCLAWLNQ